MKRAKSVSFVAKGRSIQQLIGMLEFMIGDVSQLQSHFEKQNPKLSEIFKRLNVECLSDRSKSKMNVSLFLNETNSETNRNEYFKFEIEFLQQQTQTVVLNIKSILKSIEKEEEEEVLEIFHLFVSFIKSKTIA